MQSLIESQSGPKEITVHTDHSDDGEIHVRVAGDAEAEILDEQAQRSVSVGQLATENAGVKLPDFVKEADVELT